jgi:hypothetical protein
MSDTSPIALGRVQSRSGDEVVDMLMGKGEGRGEGQDSGKG